MAGRISVGTWSPAGFNDKFWESAVALASSIHLLLHRYLRLPIDSRLSVLDHKIYSTLASICCFFFESSSQLHSEKNTTGAQCASATLKHHLSGSSEPDQTCMFSRVNRKTAGWLVLVTSVSPELLLATHIPSESCCAFKHKSWVVKQVAVPPRPYHPTSPCAFK